MRVSKSLPVSIRQLTASILTAAVLLGDCGNMPTILAAETADVPEISASENSSEYPQDDGDLTSLPTESGDIENADITETESTDHETASETEEAALPALHIGQIPMGEDFPAPNDSSFPYDLPISFENSDCLLLFSSYSLGGAAETETGTLIWSILRGEKGLTPGTTSLLNKDDDWTDYETVSSSPWFTLSTNEDTDSVSRQTAKLTAGDDSADSAHPSEGTAPADAYDYYIRAAYYKTADPKETEPFYAAVTLPFLPRQKETAKTENTQDTRPDHTASENTVTDDATVSENTTGDAAADFTDESVHEENHNTDTPSEENPDGGSALTEDAPAPAWESAVSENSVSALTPEQGSMSDKTVEPTGPQESIGILTLDAESVTLHPDKMFPVTAKIEPAYSNDMPAEIVWESSDESVASVAVATDATDLQSGEPVVDSKKAEITAIAAGTAAITATCGNRKASVLVTVVPRDDDEVYDLSGDFWVDGFLRESEALVYTGQKITQAFCVYHKETLLKAKTDYTLSYKNNVNAAAWNSAKAPSVTITLKGQYNGSITLYFTIKPRDISKIDPSPANADNPEQKDSPGYEQIVNYAKTLNLPTPALALGKKKLTAGKDFTCDYSTPAPGFAAMPEKPKNGDAYTAGESYSYTVRGKGNFTGSVPMRLVVVKKTMNFNTAAVTPDQKQYVYHGVALTKEDVTIKHVKFGTKPLDKSLYDYDVHADVPQGAYITVYPNDKGKEAGYRGFKKVNLTLVGDRNIKKAVLTTAWKQTIPFSQKTLSQNGGFFQEGDLLQFTDADAGTTDTLKEGIDYTVKYSNAKKVGIATVTFTGKGRYKGTLTKTYKITPNISNSNFSIRWKNVTRKDGGLFIAYQKGGAKPDFILLDQDQNTLKLNTDYAVTYKNNNINIKKKEETSNMTLTITGKGNYNGYQETINLTVVRANIADATLTVADKPLNKKKDFWKSAVTITDANGKKLEAKKDYLTPVTYSYPDMENGHLPQAETVITVTVAGCGSYQGEITGSYRIFDAKNNINNWKVVIDPQIYTGKAITLSAKDIHVYRNDADKKKKVNELPSTCYEIIGYKNNIKTGTDAKVTLHGLGEYGGTKTYSFKIQKKSYGKNNVKKIVLDKNNLKLDLTDTLENPETGDLSATIIAQTEEKITNPTIIWTSSNKNIAEIEELEPGISGYDSDAKAATSTSKARIHVKKEGKVTITATSQDGNKRAQCTVTIQNLPVFLDAGKEIKANIGETYQLQLKYTKMEGAGENAAAKWTSSNPNAVSVDSNGLLTMKKAGVAVIKVSVAKYKFTGQCYAIAVDPDEEKPKTNWFVYEQQPGCTDDTPHINEMLRSWEWGEQKNGNYSHEALYLPAGVYHINAVGSGMGGIILTDNQKLIMSSSTLLVALANNQKESQVIWAFGRKNVTISGGQIIGERNIHKGSGGEGGHGIRISGCTNVTIENIDISQCWGDGIWLGVYDGWEEGTGKAKKFFANDVTISNCNLHHNRRNNLSITDASNVRVQSSQFNNANGTAPQYGLDIEPGTSGYTCRDVTISGCTFAGNKGGTIQILGQLNCHVNGVTIENCIGDKAPVKWQGFGGSVKGVDIKNNNKWGK